MARAPQALESPTVRRSRYLAEALQQMRQEPERIGGYGDLGARLLAQGITQYASGKAERAVEEEAQAAQRARASRIAASLGLEIPEQPEPEAPRGNFLSRLLRGDQPEPQPQPAPASPMPQPGMQPPMPDAMTQPAAPVGPVGVGDLPPAGPPQQPMPQASQMPQQAQPQHPLGPTQREREMISQLLASGLPADTAAAESLWMEIQARQAEPAAGRYEIVNVNGVPYRVDAVTGERQAVFEGGLPPEVMARVQTVESGNPYGVAAGTGVALSPYGEPTIVGRPPEGFERVNGGLRPEAGGQRDITAPEQSFALLRDIRTEVRPVLDQATQLQRNINAVRSGARQNNGAGDIAMVNGLQKLIDEGVVREGDVALQLQSQGIQGGIAGLTAFLTSTGRFDDRIRGQLLSAAEDLYANMNSVYRDRAMGYQGMVDRTFGAGAFDDVIPPSTREAFGWSGAPPPPPSAPRAQTGPARAQPQRPTQQARSSGRRRRYNPNTGRIE